MTNSPTTTTDQGEPATYELRVQGHLDAGWAERLAVPSLVHDSDGTTIMRGIAADQAALHGLLQRLRDLGLTLIAVIQVDPNHRR